LDPSIKVLLGLSYGFEDGKDLTVSARRLTKCTRGNPVRALSQLRTIEMENTKCASYTVPVLSARNVITAASSRVRPLELCAAVGIDASRFNQQDARLPMSQLVALYETAARMTKDSAFGLHIGERTSVRAFGLFGYIVMNSATVGLALERAVRYFPLWTDGASFSLQREGSTIRLIWQYSDASSAECRHDCEMTLLSAAKVSRLSDSGIQPREVRFQHSPPKDISEHKRLFKAPVHFRMRRNEVIFDRAVLSARVRHADPDLCDLLISYAESVLAAAPSRPNLVDRIRLTIRESVGEGHMGLPRLSRTVGIGTRTLQRRLRGHDTSFRELLTGVRQELADQHLRDPERSIGEIAYRLGYANPSEFHRAFRNWRGIAPKQHRLKSTHGRPGIVEQD
jgi:AraC-like DNA-binding protein